MQRMGVVRLGTSHNCKAVTKNPAADSGKMRTEGHTLEQNWQLGVRGSFSTVRAALREWRERGLHPWMQSSRGLPKLTQEPLFSQPRCPQWGTVPRQQHCCPLSTCFSSITVHQLTWGSMCCRGKL